MQQVHQISHGAAHDLCLSTANTLPDCASCEKGLHLPGCDGLTRCTCSGQQVKVSRCAQSKLPELKLTVVSWCSWSICLGIVTTSVPRLRSISLSSIGLVVSVLVQNNEIVFHVHSQITARSKEVLDVIHRKHIDPGLPEVARGTFFADRVCVLHG